MLHKKLFLAFGLALFAHFSFAQIVTPQPSPTATLKQSIGLAEVEVVYARPSARGRAVFGSEVVAYDKLWRTGANAATTLAFNEEMTIGGVKVPAGKYSLFTIPNAQEWTIILNKNTNLWGTGGYKEEEDVARFKVQPKTLSENVETLSINFTDLTQNGANLEITWEKTKVSFPISMDVDSKVMAQIDRTMKNPQASLANNYRNAAKYYLDNNKDLKKALEWINESIKINPEAFWVVRDKALIQAALKDYKGAIQTAQQSMELAKKANNEDYVRNNQKSIDEWTKMK